MLKALTPVLVAVLLIAGCGGDDEKAEGGGGSAAATPTATPDPETAARETFVAYNEAFVARDWQAACGYMAPETIDKLRANVEKLARNVPEDCPRIMRMLITRTEQDPKTKGILFEIARTSKVKRVVVRGDSATVDWSAKREGQTVSVTNQMRRIDGEWKLVDVSN